MNITVSSWRVSRYGADHETPRSVDQLQVRETSALNGGSTLGARALDIAQPSTGGGMAGTSHDHPSRPAASKPAHRPAGRPRTWPQTPQASQRYLGNVITSVLGAPGSGKSTITSALAGLLPGHAVLDWDEFMEPAAALAGQRIPENPGTWPAYRELVHAVIGTIAHLPVVLLGVCTPDELKDWPIDAWVLLDCTDKERQRRLSRHASPQRLADAIRDGHQYRQLGLPTIDTTGLTPIAVAAELARFIQSLHESKDPAPTG